jgi:hypothetical protein
MVTARAKPQMYDVRCAHTFQVTESGPKKP